MPPKPLKAPPRQHPAFLARRRQMCSPEKPQPGEGLRCPKVHHAVSLEFHPQAMLASPHFWGGPLTLESGFGALYTII